jgi:two-component system LytT family sensor kinase
MRRPWIVVSVAWVVPALLAALQAFAQHRLGNWDGQLSRILLFEFGDWLLYGALTPIVFYLARRFPLERGHLASRLSLHLAGALFNCALWALGGTVLRRVIFSDQSAFTGRGFVGWFFTSLPFGVAVYFAVLGIEHAIFYFREARERETQAARLSAQLAEARLGALRMQMKPHFLLNSLNAILVLVRDRDHATATRVLEELGEILRQVLRTDRPEMVPLAEELDFLRRYLAIEQVRFSDRLRIRFQLDPAVEHAAVPDFILQPLVENALRHGIAAGTEAGLVAISARREGDALVLSVEDDGPGFDEGRSPTGLGLSNTRERLQVLYGTGATLTVSPRPGGGTVAAIRLPYRGMGDDRQGTHG